MRIHAALLRLEGTRPRHREALRALDADVRVSEAMLRVALICFSLWMGFWIQFLVTFYYGLVGIYVSGSLLVITEPHYFIPVTTGMGFPLVRQFLILAAAGAALAIGAGWWITRGVPGRWRMRFAVCLFASIQFGYAALNQAAEESTWRGVEKWRDYNATEAKEAVDPREREMHQWYVNYYNALLEHRR